MAHSSIRVLSAPVLSSESVNALIRAFEGEIKKAPKTGRRHFNEALRKRFMADHRVFGTVLSVLDSPEVSAYVAARCVMPYVDHVDLLIKDPGAPETFWHQDAPYWDWDEPRSMFTIWVTLVDVDEQNGCLRVVTSALDTILPHRKISHDKGVGNSQLALDLDFPGDSLTIQSLPLKAGGAVIFDSFVPHSSYANGVGKHRFAFKIVIGDRHRRATDKGGKFMSLHGLTHEVDRQLKYLASFLLLNAKGKVRSGLRVGRRYIRRAPQKPLGGS